MPRRQVIEADAKRGECEVERDTSELSPAVDVGARFGLRACGSRELPLEGGHHREYIDQLPDVSRLDRCEGRIIHERGAAYLDG